jgi:crotonobetainyl-CoA:carnitine CoA-transferase CaiB-like acyl-CoA transferase
VPTGAPRLGQHNREVWCDLVGLSESELADLTERGVV